MISIIIVNYRTPDDLCRLLESLEQNPPNGPWEAIVVDNASGDDSADRVRVAFPRVTVIQSGRNRGFAAGVNMGLARVTGDPVLILNPDIQVRPGSIDTLARFLEEHREAGLVAARLLNPDGSLQYTCRTFYTLRTILLRRTFLGRLFPGSAALRRHLMLDYDHATPRRVDWVSGACMMVRREALDEVGPMDERYFMYFEDVDWCTRMQRRGWGVWYVPDAVMVHGYRRASAGGFGRAARAHAGSLIRFWDKWSALLYLLRRHRRGIRTACLLLADLAAINLAFWAAYHFREMMAHVLEKPLFPFALYEPFLVTINIVVVSVFALTGFYRQEDRGDWLDTLVSAGRALLLSCLVLLASTFVYKHAYSRLIVLSFWPLALTAVTLERRLIYHLLDRAREQRLNVRRVALIGRDDSTLALEQALRDDPRHGFEPIWMRLPPAERPEALRAALEDERVSDAVLSGGALAACGGGLAPLIESLKDAGITVHCAGPLTDVLTRDARVAPLGGRLLVTLGSAAGRLPRRMAHRLFDLTVAVGFIIVYLLPAVLTWVALAILGRRPRKTASGAGWTAAGWGEAVLRRSSVDRYPGYWGVLAGRLSLVEGPGSRPGLFQPNATRHPREAASLPDWSAERDVKVILRDVLGRLRGSTN